LIGFAIWSRTATRRRSTCGGRKLCCLAPRASARTRSCESVGNRYRDSNVRRDPLGQTTPLPRRDSNSFVVATTER
jgi:hypothetical protein